MIIERNDVQLLSIKLKSKQDIENDVDERARVNDKSSMVLPQKRNSSLNTSSHVYEEDYDDADDGHYAPSLRLLTLEKTTNGICGFHLTRSKWDPYPWVSAVDRYTPAEKSGLEAGECVLEVNGCDVLGLRITEIATMVKSSSNQVTLLLWSSKCSSNCEVEGLCAAPMPRSMQRLSTIVQTVLSIIECPVCTDTITPPAMQCQNGHLLCVNCRIRAENCPICRDRYYPRPALIAEQLHSALTGAFSLCRKEDKVRQKIFGRHNRLQQMVKTSLPCLTRTEQVHKSSTQPIVEKLSDTEVAAGTVVRKNAQWEQGNQQSAATEKRIGKCNKTSTACNKLLTKLLSFTTNTLENPANMSTALTAMGNNATTVITPPEITSSSGAAISGIDVTLGESQPQRAPTITTNCQSAEIQRNAAYKLNDKFNTTSVERQRELLSPTAVAPAIVTATAASKATEAVVINDSSINSNPCCEQMSSNRIEHFSLSSSDLTGNNKATAAALMPAKNTHCNTESMTSPSGIVSSLPLSTTTISNNSPVFYSKRQCSSVKTNNLQSIARAIKLNNAVNSEGVLTNSHPESLCTDDFDYGDNFHVMSTNSTPSTMSLKSSTSTSSIPGFSRRSSSCSLDARKDVLP